MKTTLRCQSCRRRYPASTPIWRCDCGGRIQVEFQARFPVEEIQQRKPSLWRYREALPIELDQHIITFDEGFTPLTQEYFFGKKVLVKQDHLFPSGSFKDRGASVLVSKLHELGIKKVVEDSSGNAGAALAAYCAKADIQCHIYVPEKTSPEKLRQIRQYGAQLHKVKGSREQAARAALKQAETTYYASHYWNPFFFQGTKTCIFEIVEQLGWKPPDIILIPVGNGTLLYGIFIGLLELQQEHLIDTLPKIIGVQAENCAPLELAWRNPEKPLAHTTFKKTIAEGIAIENPRRQTDILSVIEKTKGDIISISEKEIIETWHTALRKGYYIEPTSAVAIAGVTKVSFEKEETVVIPLTGHGLKK